MTTSEHLWAIGYDDMERAEQVRDEIIRLGWDTHYLTLLYTRRRGVHHFFSLHPSRDACIRLFEMLAL